MPTMNNIKAETTTKTMDHKGEFDTCNEIVMVARNIDNITEIAPTISCTL